MTGRRRQETFADRLHKLRRQRGFLRTEVVELAGIPLSTYKRWENGQSMPAHDGGRYLRNLAEVYEVSPGWLLDGDEP